MSEQTTNILVETDDNNMWVDPYSRYNNRTVETQINGKTYVYLTDSATWEHRDGSYCSVDPVLKVLIERVEKRYKERERRKEKAKSPAKTLATVFYVGSAGYSSFQSPPGEIEKLRVVGVKSTGDVIVQGSRGAPRYISRYSTQYYKEYDLEVEEEAAKINAELKELREQYSNLVGKKNTLQNIVSKILHEQEGISLIPEQTNQYH